MISYGLCYDSSNPVGMSLLLIASCFAADTEFPSAEISNGVINAKLLLPDAEKGYYRGTRFDWSGQIQSLKTKEHEYFGQWFQKYDPKLHDAIMGPVEEFLTDEKALGYDEAPAGRGVHSHRRRRASQAGGDDGSNASKRMTSWTVGNGRSEKAGIGSSSRRNSATTTGTHIRYTKRISLSKGAPRDGIDHRLKNTGKKAIKTSQYNHNFFVLDGAADRARTLRCSFRSI